MAKTYIIAKDFTDQVRTGPAILGLQMIRTPHATFLSGLMRLQSSTSKSTPVDDSNRRFINLERSFLNQLNSGQNDALQLQPILSLQEKMRLSTNALLACNPDTMTLQLTNEGSLFYTVRKGDLAIYLQHFLVEEFDETDEAILSVYNGDINLFNHGGYLHEAFQELKSLTIFKDIAAPQFA